MPRERKLPWLPSRTHRPGLREGRKIMRTEATAWNRRRVDEIDQELQRAIGDEREALVEERRLLVKDINRTPAHAKKSPAQLDAEIAAALATPRHAAAPVPKLAAPALTPPRRTKKRVAVVWADLNVLAQAASFGDISVGDLAPSARTTARVSKTWRERVRAAGARLRSLADRGLLEEGYGEKYNLTEAGRQVLVDAGYAPTATGTWITPGARRPSWSW